MPRIVMVYPRQGFSGAYVKHMPLSLLYASAEVVKKGWDVKILDTRVVSGDWRPALRSLINDGTVLVGISVMSGSPIRNAIEIGREVKRIAPSLPVVWGGPHATFYPEAILRDDPNVDYVVSGYASRSFPHLCEVVASGGNLTGVNGLSWREGGRIRANPDTQKTFEFINWRDIPYHLIEDYGPYGQLDQDKRIFSMFSAMGCPYQCSFCSSPAQYAPIEGRKWVPLAHGEIVDHVQHVVETYGANYIYFIDDDSFPSLRHVEALIDEIRARGLPVKLGFRGARINEIKRMSHEFLNKLADAGTDIMHIGAESGSDRILALMKKNCTVEDILDCNRKLARHPSIIAAYNFIMGVPTETLDDVRMTRDLILRLVEDNPNSLVFPPNKFRPLPGTELYELAQTEWGYRMPDTLDAWAAIEVEGDIDSRRYGKGMARFCNLLLIGSYFVDNKVARVTEGKSALTRVARLINRLYGPIARFRLRHGLDRLLVEYWAYRLLTRLLGLLQTRNQGRG
ncbi:MAG: B12-binding domain-containing radical SAM protein [Alphaproteobacteria bacterium]|nr:B12-binding domain-containing radical SAM protein [Alphaproteobacteria bacterium]